jgi:hypothetical protein
VGFLHLSDFASLCRPSAVSFILGTACIGAGCPAEAPIPACVRGEEDCPAVSCGERDNTDPSTWLDPADPYEAWCDGDWTLVAVVSDDGQDTWTWANRAAWTEASEPFGDLLLRHRDLRSPAFDRAVAEQLRFAHQPSGVDAVYDLPRRGVLSAVLGDEPARCYGDEGGWPMVGGTLQADGALCSTDLFVHPVDQDGDPACDSPAEASSDAWGPTWSATSNTGCPLDDPGEVSSLGPSSVDDHDVEFGYPPSDFARGLGFGQPLGLNTGRRGTGENRVEVYVR